MNESEIERLLKNPPRPPVPPGLLERLRNDIALPRVEARPGRRIAGPSWFQRWFPATAFAIFLCACAVLIATQTATISELKKQGPTVARSPGPSAPAPAQDPEVSSSNPRKQELERLRKENAELQNLRAEAAQLRTQAELLTQIRVENQRLVSELAALEATQGGGAMAKARQKAQLIMCVNNLKQIGLAARIFANDNQDTLPPDLLSMKQHLVTPKVLHCPEDSSKAEAASWDAFGASQISYEVVTLGLKESEVEPNVVLVRCPFHGSVCLADGSVHQMPERGGASLVMKNGRQVLERTAAPIPAPKAQTRTAQ